jgi:hypothetical protein
MPLTGAGYEKVVFYKWQKALLVCTSLMLLAVACFAYTQRQLVMASAGIVTSVVSICYWLSPGPSWRRDADVLCASLSILYFLLAGSMLSGPIGMGAWLCFPGFVLCFRNSWRVSVTGDVTWAVWHAAGHVLVAAMALFLITGNVDAWLLNDVEGRRMPFTEFNPLAAASLSVVVLGVLLDRRTANTGRRRAELFADVDDGLSSAEENRGSDAEGGGVDDRSTTRRDQLRLVTSV